MKQSKWLTPSNMLLGFGSAIVLGLAIALATGKLESGIGEGTTTVTSEKTDSQGQVIERTTTTSTQNAKTLWDWLSLLGVPASLAGLGAWLQLKDQRRAKQQADLELKIAEDNRQEEALQHYLDRVSNLLIEKNLLAISAKEDATPEEKELLDVSVETIRALTLSILRRLEGNRKTSVAWFLIEADIISKLEINLRFADLSGVNLSLANLKDAKLSFANLSSARFIGADLSGAQLNDANLQGTFLNGANFSRVFLSASKLINANLSGADFSSANLSNTDFSSANLSNTNLSGADLDIADFWGAKLIGANLNKATLTGTNLSGSIGLTKEQLEGSFLCQTQLPEGIDIDPNRDCSKPSSKWLGEILKGSRG